MRIPRQEIEDRLVRDIVVKITEQMEIEDLKKVFNIKILEGTEKAFKDALEEENYLLCKFLTELKDRDEMEIVGTLRP